MSKEYEKWTNREILDYVGEREPQGAGWFALDEEIRTNTVNKRTRILLLKTIVLIDKRYPERKSNPFIRAKNAVMALDKRYIHQFNEWNKNREKNDSFCCVDCKYEK